ncbi:MAG: tetratricopeptide repeat protein [Microthrixaceae bacterium]|nr:tetratricopeptide repeat protein [Microthrixaceae bacterium]
MDDLSSTLIAGWKLRPPELPGKVGEFPTTARLAEALGRVPYVSVVAPAGSGKSTALAAWSAAPGRRRPLWVRLDRQDDDPRVLAAAFRASIRLTFDHSPARIDRLLSSTQPEPHQLGTALALDLDELDGAVVILDDIHHLQDLSSLRLVECLIDDLGPSSRIITAGRVEPPFNLAQRRVRRTVIELGASDLCLTRAQVAGILADVDVHDDILTDLILEHSGGWAAAAVLLAANATSATPPGPETAIPPLAGDLDIDAFLRTEVLDPMDPTLREFVLRTSLLASLDPSACAALTGAENAAALLTQVRRHGLAEVVAPPGGSTTGQELRYQDRIAAFLRNELAARCTPEQRAELHRRAAAASPPMHAIELLLDIGDVEAAGTMVAEVGRQMLDSPGTSVPRSWLAAFDEDQLASQPWPAVLAGLAAVEDGDVATALRQLAPAVATMRDSDDLPGFARGAYGLAEAHLAWGQVDQAAELIDELLSLDTTPDERTKALVGRLWLDYFGADWEAVESGLDEAFSLAFSSCSEAGRSAVALGLGTEFLFAPRGAAWLSDRAAELARRIDRDIMAITNLELIGAAAHLVAGRIEQAQAVSVSLDERALELGSLNWLAMAADRVRLGVALAAGDHRNVTTIVDGARRLLGESDRHHQERAMYAYATARSGPDDGRIDRVRTARILLGDVSGVDRPDTTVTAGVLDALLCREEGDLEGAEAALTAVDDLHQQVRFCLLTGLPELELAAVRLESGRHTEAVETARPMLARLSLIDGVGLPRDGRAGCAPSCPRGVQRRS